METNVEVVLVDSRGVCKAVTGKGHMWGGADVGLGVRTRGSCNRGGTCFGPASKAMVKKSVKMSKAAAARHMGAQRAAAWMWRMWCRGSSDGWTDA